MLKIALTSYANRALIEYNVVVMPKSGHIAVFSTEHAIAHAHGTDKGTARAPNTRKRADLLTSPVQQAGTPAPPLIGGSAGHPAPTPSQPTVPVPPTAPAPASRTTTELEDTLGVEVAKRYRIAPEIIEEAQLQFLNFFLEDMVSERLADTWRKKCNDSGNEFITKFVEHMTTRATSVTAEETIETAMRGMLERGLLGFGEINYPSYLDFIGEYDDLNKARAHPIDDTALAFQYKRLITSLGPAFSQSMQLKIPHRGPVPAAQRGP